MRKNCWIDTKDLYVIKVHSFFIFTFSRISIGRRSQREFYTIPIWWRWRNWFFIQNWTRNEDLRMCETFKKLPTSNNRGFFLKNPNLAMAGLLCTVLWWFFCLLWFSLTFNKRWKIVQIVPKKIHVSKLLRIIKHSCRQVHSLSVLSGVKSF